MTRFLLAVLMEMTQKTYRIFEVEMEEDARFAEAGARTIELGRPCGRRHA